MTTPDFHLKTGDTGSTLTATLTNSGGTAVNIQGAAVRFLLGPVSGGTLVRAAAATNAQVDDGSDGTRGDVSYSWGTALVTAGLYRAEWEVTFVSGTIVSFPNGGYNLLWAEGALG